MRHVRRRDDDVACVRDDGVLAHGERRLSLLDDEGLGIRVVVQPGAVPRLAVYQEERNRRAMVGAVEAMRATAVGEGFDADDAARRKDDGSQRISSGSIELSAMVQAASSSLATE